MVIYSSINSRTNIKEHYNKYSGVNIDKDSNIDNGTDITLSGNIDD